MTNITKAIIATMEDIEGVEKGLTVGEGKNAYKGVSDYDVKKLVRKAMMKNGLIIYPIENKTELNIRVYDEVWNGVAKQKQSVFVSVDTKYKVQHTSGESIEISGSGHGVDSQDKAIGKATTYALKYALLYLFLIPTGAIDDTDNQHSESLPVPTTPVLTLEMALKDVKDTKDLKGLQSCWSKYKAYQKVPAFMEAKEEMKGKLK